MQLTEAALYPKNNLPVSAEVPQGNQVLQPAANPNSCGFHSELLKGEGEAGGSSQLKS